MRVPSGEKRASEFCPVEVRGFARIAFVAVAEPVAPVLAPGKPTATGGPSGATGVAAAPVDGISALMVAGSGFTGARLQEKRNTRPKAENMAPRARAPLIFFP